MTTLHDALDAFVTQLAADGRSRHSIAQVRRHVQVLRRWLAAQGALDDVGALNAGQVARFLASPDALHKADGSAKRVSSANAMRTSVRCFGRFLHDAELVASNPARLVRRALSSAPPPKPLPEADVERLLAAMQDERTAAARRDYALFATLRACGLRVGSAVAARVEDLDLDGGTLTVRTAKGGAQGRVFLPRLLVQILRDHVGDRTSGALFQASHGGPTSTRSVAARLEYWAQRAGVRGSVSPHRWRHAFATHLLRETRDVELVRRALLHRSISSTVTYLEVCDDRLRAAVGG